jgi:outer membrane PBP1 activator LpoA protein
VLRLSDSRARARRLESALGTSLEFLPRRRGDIGFIFAPAPATTARMLRPQLRFHYAGDIPAYATSDAWEPGLTSNQDLEGLLFPDMPWVLSGGPGVERLRAATAAAFGDANRSRSKLYAFGHDAWLLATALRAGNGADPTAIRVDGATGRVSFDAAGRTRRELDWAQVRGGNARLLTAETE